MGDVWEIGVIAPVARERTGYPSQKPEALLDRLVLALTDPGDIILDPYAGSGTTLAVASKRGRRFLGIDQSHVAIETALNRLAEAGSLLAPSTTSPGVVPPSACADPRRKPTVSGDKGPSLRRTVDRGTP